MTKDKKMQYQKAYVELNEIIKVIPQEQKNKIPKEFINNLVKNMDMTYHFKLDESKGILEQNLRPETRSFSG